MDTKIRNPRKTVSSGHIARTLRKDYQILNQKTLDLRRYIIALQRCPFSNNLGENYIKDTYRQQLYHPKHILNELRDEWSMTCKIASPNRF